MKTIYELPIGYWRAGRELMEEEAELQPEWARTLPGNVDSEHKLQRKDEELALASHVVVPSNFVRQTLEKARRVTTKISVVPYGAPATVANARKLTKAKDPLRVVFVGALTQRKGISYLLRAIEQLGSSVVLTLIGRCVGECRVLDGALPIHRWFPSLSHSQVLQELSRQDVMVFPSLFEGFGLVLLEAMANGVPVIATPNGAAPDLVTDGEDGFLISIRDADAIAEKLEVLSRDRERLLEMSAFATRKAALHTWEQYRELLATNVHSALADNGPARSNLDQLFHASA
jgi:glycosyltransferase involved in cell wall biosynthesis